MLPLLWAAEGRGCQHGPLNQMAINPLHTNTGPKKNLHHAVHQRVLEQSSQMQSENFNKPVYQDLAG